MNSAACWVPFGVALIILGIVWRMRLQPKLIGAAVVFAMVAGFGSYFWYGKVEGAADARDAYVIETLTEGGVTFEDFQDEDTERVRVSRMVGGKKCSATFDVVLGDYEGKWPLTRGTGRYASSGCGVDDVKDTSGLIGSEDEGLEGARSYYLDKIFAPAK